MIKIVLPILLIVWSCSQSNPRYEYLEKNDSFRKKIGKENFVKSTHGFTYYESQNLDHEEVLVFIHGFSVPSYIWDETYFEAIYKLSLIHI